MFVCEALGAASFVALVGGVFVVAGRMRAAGVAPESTRKTAHVGTSAATLALPALVHERATAVALAIGASCAIGALRRTRRLRFLDDARKTEWSEHCFIAAIAIVFVLAHDDALSFRAPILVLGVSDALAAVVGKRWGRHRYTVGAATRSWEGSLAFVASAWLVLLAVSAHVTFTSAAAAAAIALVAAGVEAISTKGRDNLTIPLATLAMVALLHGVMAP